MPDLLHILISDIPQKKETNPMQDIRQHLLYLLNSQREATVHLPFYGLPNLSYLRTNLPYSEGQLLDNIRETLLHHEPRLQNLRIIKDHDCPSDSYILKIKIEAISKNGELLQYGGYVSPTGELHIE